MPTVIPAFFGTIKDGALEFRSNREREAFKNYLTSIQHKTKPETKVKILVKRYNDKRTSGKDDEGSNQNGYYWGVVIPIIANELGYTSDEMHQAIKFHFLRTGGTENLPKVKGTSELQKDEWEELMEKIRAYFSSEFSIKIPSVEEYYNGDILAV